MITRKIYEFPKADDIEAVEKKYIELRVGLKSGRFGVLRKMLPKPGAQKVRPKGHYYECKNNEFTRRPGGVDNGTWIGGSNVGDFHGGG